MNPTRLWYDTLDTPIGTLRLVADDTGLRRICFPRDRHPRPEDAGGEHAPARFADVRRQLGEYFDGKRKRFELRLAPHGTPFQRRVWEVLREIPWGETWSYADVARRLGQPTATRAVGAANGRNPLPIVVPCHRVVGADGSLTGFGGGLGVKSALLTLEGHGGELFAEELQRAVDA